MKIIIFLIFILNYPCNAFALFGCKDPDVCYDLSREIYDKNRSLINVVNRIQINEKRGYEFSLDKQKTIEMKEKYGTSYIYKSKNGSDIKIYAVYKIFNEPDQSYYYILEDENENPVANVKLITNKKGKVIKAEVVNGK